MVEVELSGLDYLMRMMTMNKSGVKNIGLVYNGLTDKGGGF
jgi:hypothetical protein